MQREGGWGKGEDTPSVRRWCTPLEPTRKSHASAPTPESIGGREQKMLGEPGHPPDPGVEPKEGTRTNAHTHWKRREGWEDGENESGIRMSTHNNPPHTGLRNATCQGGTGGKVDPASLQQSPGTDGMTSPAPHTPQLMAGTEDERSDPIESHEC